MYAPTMWTSDARHLRSSTSQPLEDDASNLHWTLALAGGDGQRLTAYVERRFGQRIPKQYCRLLGNRSMLQHTLERLEQADPAGADDRR